MESSSSKIQTCLECGAECLATATTCWLCKGNFSTDSEIVLAELVEPRPKYAPSDVFFLIVSAILAVLLLLVGIGAAVEQPGLGIAFFVVVAIPLIATVVRVQSQEAKRGSLSFTEKFLTFVVTASMTAGLIVIVVGAAFVAFFVYCMVEMSKQN